MRDRRVGFAAALITLAAFIAYHGTFAVPFLFDDLPAIVENPSIRSLSSLGGLRASDQPGGLTTSGRPVVHFSLALNYALSGYQVWSYHAVNLAIHLAAALCLFGLVRRTLLMPRLAQRFGTAATPLAAATALLWAVHPVQTESVTYIVQRAESLVALFYLLTLYAFARAVEAGQRADARPKNSAAAASKLDDERTAGADAPASKCWMGLAAVACALGMASKEVMVSAPLIVLLYDRTFVSGTFRDAWRRHRRWHLALASTWLLLAALVFGTADRGGTAGFSTAISPWIYALTQCRALVHYVALAVWPFPLVFDHGLATARDLSDVFLQGIAVLAALGATVIALRRWPALGFLAATFFAVLAPSSSFVPIVTQTIAEHRMYLPLATLCVAAAVGAYIALGLRVVGVCVAATLACALVTRDRNHDYRDERTLWADTAAKLPTNARAHNNLGQALFRAGQIDAAIASYRRALELQPRYPETHYNLGVAFARQADIARAIEHYEAALRIEPDYPEALNNLGNALVQAGRLDEALRRYEEALRRHPTFAEARNNLGNALLQANRLAEARPQFERAIQLRPDYAEAYYNLGNVLAAASDMSGALERYRQAVRLDPRYAAAHVNAGNALLELKRPAEALTHYEAAIAADATLPDAHFNRGSLLLDLERWSDAIPSFQALLQLKPDAAEPHRALGFALAQTGRTAEAIRHYERYLVLQPDDATARQELAQLRRLRP